MNRLDYLERHHHISSTLIGIISISDDKEQIDKALWLYKAQLKNLEIKRVKGLAQELGWSEDQTDSVLDMMGLK